MAVIEIAKIRVRRGQETVTGLPTLDSGEFGWAIDTQNLYIGNGSLAEGAPLVGNTRVLTSHDLNLFNLPTSTAYSYLQDDAGQHRNSGVTIWTDPGGNDLIIRQMKDKLNDFTTIYDFGGVSDGIDADNINGEALQNAIDQLWLNGDKSSTTGAARSRVALRIPAGLYLINRTIYLPPYTTLIGEGQQKTILRLTQPNMSLLQSCDITSSPGAYVLYRDGATALTKNVTNINLIGLTIEYAPALGGNNGGAVQSTLPLVRLDGVSDSQVLDCRFNGYCAAGDPTHTLADYNFSALELRGQGAITTKDLLIENSTFEGFFYGIFSNYDIQDIIIDRCVFRKLSRGFVGGQQIFISDQVGPSRVRIENNRFDTIEQEAIYFGSNNYSIPTYNISSHNSFIEVGNNINGEGSPYTAVVNFQSIGNRSIDDYFDRFSVHNGLNIEGHAPIDTYFRELIEGIGYIESTSVVEMPIQGGGGGIAILARFPLAIDTESLKLQYSLRKQSINVARKGELSINVSVTGNVPTATLSETYSYNGPNNGMIEFALTTNTVTNALNLIYTNNGTTDGTISYKYSQLR
jgi:hypothetical protein